MVSTSYDYDLQRAEIFAAQMENLDRFESAYRDLAVTLRFRLEEFQRYEIPHRTKNGETILRQIESETSDPNVKLLIVEVLEGASGKPGELQKSYWILKKVSDKSEPQFLLSLNPSSVTDANIPAFKLAGVTMDKSIYGISKLQRERD